MFAKYVLILTIFIGGSAREFPVREFDSLDKCQKESKEFKISRCVKSIPLSYKDESWVGKGVRILNGYYKGKTGVITHQEKEYYLVAVDGLGEEAYYDSREIEVEK